MQTNELGIKMVKLGNHDVWKRTDYFSWKGTTIIIQSNCLTNSGLAKSWDLLLKALSKCL